MRNERELKEVETLLQTRREIKSFTGNILSINSFLGQYLNKS